MDESLQSETSQRILAAAEELFAERGYDGTSMRNITQKAGVNLAASHYHHGDKETLYLLILSRRLKPINETRLSLLGQAEREAKGQPVPITRILEIMSLPLFELCADSRSGGRHFARILGRSLVEPLPFMDAILAREFQPVMARFTQALRRHVPNLSPEEFLWRLSFVIGALHHTLATIHCMKDLTHGICRDHDHAGAGARFIQFAAVSFTAATTLPPNEATGSQSG